MNGVATEEAMMAIAKARAFDVAPNTHDNAPQRDVPKSTECTVSVEGARLLIKLNHYDPDIVSAIKAIEGRVYNGDHWSLPHAPETIQNLIENAEKIPSGRALMEPLLALFPSTQSILSHGS